MKRILALILILTMVFFAGCGKKNDDPADDPIVDTGKIEENNNDDNGDQDQVEIGQSRIDHFPEAAEGRFTDSQIRFYDSKEKVYKLLGEPDEIYPWQGSDLYVYDNFGVYLDPESGEVLGLTAGEGYKTYGVEIGMTEEEILSVLGQPDGFGENFENGDYFIDYEAGDYAIEFAFLEEGGKSIGVSIYNLYNYKGE